MHLKSHPIFPQLTSSTMPRGLLAETSKPSVRKNFAVFKTDTPSKLYSTLHMCNFKWVYTCKSCVRNPCNLFHFEILQKRHLESMEATSRLVSRVSVNRSLLYGNFTAKIDQEVPDFLHVSLFSVPIRSIWERKIMLSVEVFPISAIALDALL